MNFLKISITCGKTVRTADKFFEATSQERDIRHCDKLFILRFSRINEYNTIILSIHLHHHSS